MANPLISTAINLFSFILLSGGVSAGVANARQQNSLILVVSKHMPYSMQFVPVVKKCAKNKHLSLQVLTDEDKMEPEIRAKSLRHYPTLFFVKEGKRLDLVIPGIQTEKELESHLDEIYNLQ